MLLQDIIKDDEIKLDLFFKASLIYDLVKVPSVIMLIKLTILYDIYKRINYTKPIYLYSQGMQQRERKKRRKKLNICIQVDLYVTHVVICRPICYPKIQTRVACRPRQVFCGLLLLVVRVFMFSDRPN